MFKFFNSWRHRRTLINYLKGFTTPLTSQSLNPNPLFHHFCTNTSDSTSLAVSYLINNFGFDPQSASKLCSTYHLRFKTTQKPESFLTFFRNYGFSNSQLRHMIAKMPELLTCKPSKTVLPKFQFFLSRGASTSDIVNIVTKSPRVLYVSLNNQIVPAYELVYRFLQSDKEILEKLNYSANLLCDCTVQNNITMLIENGVSDSNIKTLLREQTRIFKRRDMLKSVKELKDLGFNPSKTTFGVALHAKTTVNNTLWKEKVDAFKKWGWSEEDSLEAFRKKPYCMLTSIDKIHLVMNFWVNQLGWDAMAIAKTPYILSLSLEKRIIPRAAVVQFLLNKGLTDKNASLTYPFVVTDKLFLNMFIKRFENEASYLLKLYEEKCNLG
ncbi:putative transcription regulator mTERF family [Medicago truncatula]|uniref:Putative transcription regulator mTERF family n=1 Tax=Medicago truncatula TaxID=3880 RepID=A0A072V6I2_MEDTR|nr:uncharacterized protein LOC25488104 [Medicago truncatula]KEH37231.1 mTERF protein [Medicago truncatula]RHN73181.1 putative transcription regulator mTERF family [Medicago truncatula]